jgi:hypothetical protein
MSFHSPNRPRSGKAARLLASYRLELLTLEDRAAPGLAGVGQGLALSLLGPALAGLQLDALVGVAEQGASAPAVHAASSSGTQAVLLDHGNTPPPSEWAPVASTAGQPAGAAAPAPAAPETLPSSGAPTRALDLGAQEAQHSALKTPTGNPDTGIRPPLAGNGNVTAPVPFGVAGNPRPGENQRPTGVGSKFTVVGPNLQANSSFVCSGGNGKVQSETAITHSGGTIVVGYNDFRGFYCPGNGYQVTGWAYSTDRGRSFHDGGSLPGGTSHSGDPWLATDPDGTIYYVDLWQAINGLAIMRGTPTGSGVTWSSPVAKTGIGADKESISVDPAGGHLYITFTRFSGGSGIWSYRSTDGGVTLTGPTAVTTASNTQGSVSAVGPNGEVYVAYQVNTGSYTNPTGIGFARSLDHGATFQVIGTVAPNTGGATFSGTDRDPQFPHIAVDTSNGPNRGNIYITYHSNTLGGGTGYDALIIRSTDGGSTWSAPKRINDDGTSADQWFPTVNVDSSGFVHSIFNDRRGQTGTNTNIYYARSDDGGLTWEPNVRVTAQAFAMSTSSDGTPAWGDYINADTQGLSLLASYADGISGNPDAFFTRIGNR